MLQNRRLVIYPTSRAVRANLQESLKVDSILPKMLTIGDFEQKALLVAGRTFVDEDTRILLLKEASDFSTFQNLHIDREFFAFLKNAPFLFSFFEELSVEGVKIEDLQGADMYASYGEHLEILQRLLEQYKALLDQQNYCDKILLPSLYTLNQAYLCNFDEIILHLEGYLNNFEFEIFTKIAQTQQVIIHLHTNHFNHKMMKRFLMLGFELKVGYAYQLNLSTRTIVKSEVSKNNETKYETFSSNSRILQTAFVKKTVYDFLSQGILPEEIVVVLPSSSFASLLALFDEENNFNFAMGQNYKESRLYQEMAAFYEYAIDRTIENKYRLGRMGYDKEKRDARVAHWNERMDSAALLQEFRSFTEKKSAEELEVFHRELHLFSKLFPTFVNYPFHKVLHLFLNRLATCRLDDVRGGRITVMEVLETRGVAYRGVVVVDFNEGIVPNKSQKDLFLSTDIRYLAGLPTSLDRENLQKYYYQRLFEKAEIVRLSYVEDEQNQPTRFLSELSIQSAYHDTRIEAYHDILFAPRAQKQHFLPENIEMEYDFSKVELSASRLKTYLDCKRRYYFKYIRNFEEAKVPSDENTERKVGIFLHKALEDVYHDTRSFMDSDTLFLALQKQMYQLSQEDMVLRFYTDIWLEHLKGFAREEVKRFRDGAEVAYVEESLSCDYHGMKLTGKIDRIDRYHDKLYVIDYKSGKIPNTTKKSLETESNFQLQFYAILAGKLGEVDNAYYYDLTRAKLVDEALFEEKMAVFEGHLEALKVKAQNFTMTENLKNCEHCPYIKICDRMG